MPHNKFWLYDWIDTFEIKELSQAENLLKDAGLRKDLQKRAAEVPFTTEEISPSDTPTIVAGRAIDLSGELDCFAWECMKKQVDKLFSHVWHYFDRIVVVGPSAHKYSSLLKPDAEPQVIERLLTYVRLLLYVREIGAEDLLIFRQKRPPCEVHLEEHLKEVGLDSTLMLGDELIEKLASRAEISAEVHDDHLDYTFIHPEFEHTVWGAIKKSDARSDIELRHAVTASVIKRYLANLASDIYTAQVLGSPLGSTVHFHGQLLNTFKAGLEEADVAFQLKLPVLEEVSPDVLLKVRYDERPHFEKFRQSLRLAIKQRLENASSEKANEIAEEIRRDVINPALNDIELRLKAAKSAVTKKTGLSLSLGALATTCGLLTANPFLIAAGATPAVGYTIAAGQKFIEENRDITLSDMYFLWQAQEHSKIHK
jgi:hypothetical protein